MDIAYPIIAATLSLGGIVALGIYRRSIYVLLLLMPPPPPSFLLLPPSSSSSLLLLG